MSKNPAVMPNGTVVSLKPATESAAARSSISAPVAAMPPEQPIAMPTQSLDSWDNRNERRSSHRESRMVTWLSRFVVFGGGVAVTIIGGYEMYQVISIGPSVTFLQWLLWALFLLNFSWIALAFCNGVLGFVSLLLRPRNMIAVPERSARARQS